MPSPIQRSSAGSVPASNGATSTTRGLTAALAGAVNATSAVRIPRIPRITAGRGSRIVLPPFRVSTPTSGNDSLPRPRSEAPQRDLGHHHHSHQTDEPGPDVDGNARLAPTTLERLARLAKRTPTRQLSQLSEPRETFQRGRRQSRIAIDVWPWLVGLVAVMMVPEIALRRLGAGAWQRIIPARWRRDPERGQNDA